MVGRHQSVEGCLFKKYSNKISKISLDDQLANYECRIEGASRLRTFISEHHLRHIAVPQKWLYEIPTPSPHISRISYILVVEELKLLDKKKTERAYRHIDKSVLRELCLVLFHFRGLDSITKNMPFTKDGRVAFIDTEHWRRHDRLKKEGKKILSHIDSHLSDKRRKLAKKLIKELEG